MPIAIAAPIAITSATVPESAMLSIFNCASSDLTGSLSVNGECKDEKRIVEGWANIFRPMGLKPDRGVDTACPGSDICGHEVI